MTRWVIHDDGLSALLCPARGAVRWDIRVRRTIPGHAPTAQIRARLACQIRQDLWRAVRHVRGFVPLVAVSDNSGVLVLEGGGRLDTASGHRPSLSTALGRVLDDPRNTTRWTAWAARPRQRREPCSKRS